MAQATAYNMNSARGAREDLSDQLKRVEPQETPLYSLLPQSSAPNAMLTEWNIDDLGAPNIQPVLDGTDLVFAPEVQLLAEHPVRQEMETSSLNLTIKSVQETESNNFVPDSPFPH